jgi:hypothetical protein
MRQWERLSFRVLFNAGPGARSTGLMSADLVGAFSKADTVVYFDDFTVP